MLGEEDRKFDLLFRSLVFSGFFLMLGEDLSLGRLDDFAARVGSSMPLLAPLLPRELCLLLLLPALWGVEECLCRATTPPGVTLDAAAAA